MEADDATPRARAAWAHSRLDQQEFAQLAGVGYDRLREILRPGNRSDVAAEELWAIADAAGVPRVFMEDGWDALQTDDHEARILRLESTVGRLVSLLATRESGAAARDLAKTRRTPAKDPRRQRSA